MKKGKYRFLIQSVTEVLITVDNPALARLDYELWATTEDLHLTPEVKGKPENWLRTLATRIAQDKNPIVRGTTYKIEYDCSEIEPIRSCRHCGCTKHNPCSLSTGPCSWVAADVCSNPYCVALETAQAEKEVQP